MPDLSPSIRTPPATPAETPAVAQTPEDAMNLGSSGRGSVDSLTLDMLRLDDAAKVLRRVWAYHPSREPAPWEDIGEPSRETWRRAAAATIQAYGVAAR